MSTFQLRIDGIAINPVTEGVLRQYLGDGMAVNAEIDFSDGNINIEPKTDWERSLTGAIEWLDKIRTVLVNVRDISGEALGKIHEHQKS